MNNFWQDLPQPFFILAPMEAVTDVVFRHVVTEAARPDVYFSEFTNAASYFSEKGRPSTRGRLAFTKDEQPMVAQIWGTNPEHFAFMAKGLKEQGYAGIDINMGCPAKDVVKTGGGSGLIATPELAAEVIAAAKESGLPVSVKTRLGIASTSEWHDWLTHLLKQDIVNLTIHLRTRKEMSKVDAHYEFIADIVKLRDEIAPQTKLSINGDVRNRAHGMELVNANPGVNGVMIGRGIFTDPYAFANETLAQEIADEKENNPEAHKKRLLGLLNMHLDLFDKYTEELEQRPFDPLKRFFKIYVRDFPGASELRDKLMHTKSTDEVRELIKTA